MSAENATEERRSIKIPHTFILLLIVGALVSISTYFFPAGEFVRVAGPGGRMMVDPSSYSIIPSTPTTFMNFLIAIPKGFVESGWIIVMTFCVGGGFAVLRKTGVIEVGVNKIAHAFADRGIVIIPVLMLLFASIDTFIGMPELCMVYVPIILPLMLALGYDSITACAVALCGSAAGFTAAITNPFTVAIAQKIAELPLYSGSLLRVIFFAVLVAVGSFFVARYAKRVKADPSSSSMYKADQKSRGTHTSTRDFKTDMTGRQKLAAFSGVAVFFTLLGGVFMLGWDLPQMAAMFILMGAVSGVASGLTGDEICDSFVEGCRDVLLGALIIGVARSINVIMVEAQVIDTIVNGLGTMLNSMPTIAAPLGMEVFQTLFNFLMPSGSGKTLITMPIMAPLSDIVGITRQTSILALQIGDGFSNILWPTSGYFMATLAIAKVPWTKWVKFFFPLFIAWTLVGAGFLIVAYLINWGPF
ncbi:AbgT family transporter [Pseudovibrio sp. Tun.PSC04-5.I4]|uniref:YfcC family protein n=1 Tax=Pseudovibrio sp. Tun.PSC04-5.I4 TaxID=1798213 RepID=UPI0008808F96|nr:AbgT family transporter [Pseudovibrio sp. Tun.PSC04-5.I4]SDQ73562.1 Uncharacterized membrane protein YfcC, ion transporter superfamily [Pseudovibrio sp. Tun.PSC04-5.I4]